MNTIIKSILAGVAIGGLVRGFVSTAMTDDVAAKAIYVRDKQREEFVPKQDIDEDDFIEEKELEKIIDTCAQGHNGTFICPGIFLVLLSLVRGAALTWHAFIPLIAFGAPTIRDIIRCETSKLNKLYKRYKKEERQ